MPTIAEMHTPYLPQRMIYFQEANRLGPANTVQPMTTEQFKPFNVEPPIGTKSATPQEVKVSLDDIKDVSNKSRRLGFWAKTGLALLGLAIVGICVGVPVALLKKNTTSDAVDSSTTVTMTTDTTTTTVTVVCVSPYAVTSINTCVNTLIDINNCGAIGNACGSSYTSCSAGVCSSAPGVQLANSNFVWTAALNGSVDDSYFGLSLPFNITMYTTTTDYVYVTTNGVLCLGSCSGAYSESNLPTGTFPGATAFGYWDDLYIYSGTSQVIYFAPAGNAPSRTVTFEFYTSHFGASNQYYHFQIVFFENRPGIVQFIYFDSSDGGASCTIGVQGSGSGPYIQYSYDVANSVASNMTLTFDTNNGTMTNSTTG